MSSFLDQSAGYLINMTALLLKREFSSVIKNHNIDVTPEQWAILNRLNENSDLTQKEVAKLTFKDNANITRMVDKLEKKGLVIRKSDANDRRSWKLSITLINEHDDALTYRLVGPDEWDVKKGEISIDSPMARALLGKQVDDEVIVKTPEGERYFDIEKVWYK